MPASAVHKKSTRERSDDHFAGLFVLELEYLPSYDDKMDRAGFFAKAAKLPLDQFLLHVVILLHKKQQ